MHVLVIPSWYVTEEQPVLGSFFHEHAIALSQSGVRVGILYPEIRQLRALTPTLLLKNHFQITTGMEGPLQTCRLHGWNLFPKWMKKQMEAWSFFAEKLMKSYIKAFGKPDLIQAQSSVWAGIAAKKISEKYAIPYCVTEHASVFMKQKVLGTDWSQCWSTPYIQKAFDHAAAVVAVSAQLKKALEPYTSQSIHVIPNVVDTSRFFPKKRDPHKKTFQFLTVSHLVPRKNLSLLLQALKQLQDENAHLTIGGDGPERRVLEELVQKLGLQNRVTFLGALSRQGVIDAFQKADAFVLASQHETFGVVCIEAMASGIPVVATRCGGTEDIVTEEVGCLVEVNQVDALVDGMKKVKLNSHTFEPEKLHQMASANFGPQAVSKQYKTLYHSIKSYVH